MYPQNAMGTNQRQVGKLTVEQGPTVTVLRWRGDRQFVGWLDFGIYFVWLGILLVCTGVGALVLEAGGRADDLTEGFWLSAIVCFAPALLVAYIGLRLTAFMVGRSRTTTLTLTHRGLELTRAGPLGARTLVPFGAEPLSADFGVGRATMQFGRGLGRATIVSYEERYVRISALLNGAMLLAEVGQALGDTERDWIHRMVNTVRKQLLGH